MQIHAIRSCTKDANHSLENGLESADTGSYLSAPISRILGGFRDSCRHSCGRDDWSKTGRFLGVPDVVTQDPIFVVHAAGLSSIVAAWSSNVVMRFGDEMSLILPAKRTI